MVFSKRRCLNVPGIWVVVLVGCGLLLAHCRGKSTEEQLSFLFPASLEPSDHRLVPSSRISIGAVGDIMLARYIGEVIGRDGWASPFNRIKDLFEGVDIGFANLESPAAFVGSPYPGKDPNITFRANPGTLLGLKYAGIDVVSLANNHANDYGPLALLETIDALKVLGIECSGAGADYETAHRPVIIQSRGYKVAILSYAEPFWSVVPAASGPGVCIIKKDEILKDIAYAKEGADIILVSLHWGVEYAPFPQERDRQLARTLIDGGAHGIIGHHPHVLQGVELYKTYPIIYSLGNCIFDMRAEVTFQTVFASLEYKVTKGEPVLVDLTLVPLLIEKPAYRPTPARGEELKKIQQLLHERSSPFGSSFSVTPEGNLTLSLSSHD